MTSAPPSQNRSKPSPVPGPSTDTSTSPFWPRKASPASDETGSTVDDPVTVTEPVTVVSARAVGQHGVLVRVVVAAGRPEQGEDGTAMARGRMPGVASR